MTNVLSQTSRQDCQGHHGLRAQDRQTMGGQHRRVQELLAQEDVGQQLCLRVTTIFSTIKNKKDTRPGVGLPRHKCFDAKEWEKSDEVTEKGQPWTFNRVRC